MALAKLVIRKATSADVLAPEGLFVIALTDSVYGERRNAATAEEVEHLNDALTAFISGGMEAEISWEFPVDQD